MRWLDAMNVNLGKLRKNVEDRGWGLTCYGHALETKQQQKKQKQEGRKGCGGDWLVARGEKVFFGFSTFTKSISGLTHDRCHYPTSKLVDDKVH